MHAMLTHANSRALHWGAPRSAMGRRCKARLTRLMHAHILPAAGALSSMDCRSLQRSRWLCYDDAQRTPNGESKIFCFVAGPISSASKDAAGAAFHAKARQQAYAYGKAAVSRVCVWGGALAASDAT